MKKLLSKAAVALFAVVLSLTMVVGLPASAKAETGCKSLVYKAELGRFNGDTQIANNLVNLPLMFGYPFVLPPKVESALSLSREGFKLDPQKLSLVKNQFFANGETRYGYLYLEDAACP